EHDATKLGCPKEKKNESNADKNQRHAKRLNTQNQKPKDNVSRDGATTRRLKPFFILKQTTLIFWGSL
ncbi:MAG: hypothetical protein V4507_14530, partial [Verrucomicrobiota bacterium]